MSPILAQPGQWILWALFIANTFVYAASVSKPGLIAYQHAKTWNETIRIEKFDPSPGIQRQFEVSGGQLLDPKVPDNHLLTEHLSYYTIQVNAYLLLENRHDDDTRLDVADRQTLLTNAMIYFTWKRRTDGEDTPLPESYDRFWPMEGRTRTCLNIGDPEVHLTYGVVADALREIEMFDRTYPAKKGNLVAMIKIPHLVPPHLEPWEKYVGYVSIFNS